MLNSKKYKRNLDEMEKHTCLGEGVEETMRIIASLI
jgi:hypothetical protein